MYYVSPFFNTFDGTEWTVVGHKSCFVIRNFCTYLVVQYYFSNKQYVIEDY